MLASSVAATQNVATSTHTALLVPSHPARSAPRAGPAMSISEASADRVPLATGTSSGGTIDGSAPNTAASVNTNIVAAASAAAYTTGTGTSPKSPHRGTTASEAPSSRLPRMMMRRRSALSATDPATRPITR